MTTGFLQLCLLLGVFVPLASFVFLAFFGTRLPGRGPGGHGHDEHDAGHGHGGDAHASDAHVSEHGQHAAGDGHGHGDHGFPPKVRRVPKGNPTAGIVATLAIGFSLAMATLVLLAWWAADDHARVNYADQSRTNAVVWASMGSVPITFGVKLDSLTVIMFLMVSLCATCIHVFSIGYMRHDPRFARFFTYLSLFCFSMLGLVVSHSIFFLFVFWELVGLCSYLLIGFWFEKKSASDAAIKAFVTNRVGDFGFLIGMMLLFTYVGDLTIDGSAAIFEAGARYAGLTHGAPSDLAREVPSERAASVAALFSTTFLGVNLATWMGIGLFCGAIGKSAQFPLQVWLPDAMEGPTPVSALIHAATMVAAGVFLVGRIFTMLTPEAQLVIAVIGCITLTMAALIAIVQTDIKRVLAYSTLSQLGYMIFGLGVGAWIGALFHLLTHAFFKAMLFLGSGQVIEACHHEQDMRRMGGLWRKLPGTAFTFLVAVLAISGAGIPWTALGLGGFYSKDEILAVSWYRHHEWRAASSVPEERHARRRAEPDAARIVAASSAQEHAAAPPQRDTQAHAAPGRGGGHDDADYPARYPGVAPLPYWLLLLPILIAYVTPFYMGRCFILTFLGRPRDPHVYEHAHESRIMVIPLYVLAAMTAISGWMLFRAFVADAAPQHAPLVPAIDGHAHAVHAVHGPLGLAVGFAFVVGLGLAWGVYRNGLALADSIRRLPGVAPLYQLLWNKFYFDEVYNFALVGGTRLLAVISGLFDAWVIDGLVNLCGQFTKGIAMFAGRVLDDKGVDGAVNGTGRLAWEIGGALRSAHSGLIRNYVLLAATVVAGVMLSLWSVSLAVVFVLLGACLVVAPAFFVHVAMPVALAAVLVRVGTIVAEGFGRTGDPGQWDWNGLRAFWSGYVASGTRAAELGLMVLLALVLYARFVLRAPAEPQYASARP